jgi:hypothetical protein
MSQAVVIIAEGQTERRSLPHLVAHLHAEGISIVDIRIPPSNRALTVEMAEKLVKATWFERIDSPPDKFVVLCDTDGKDADTVLRPFRDQLRGRLGAAVHAQLQYACAQWHLEAWYFGDALGLRAFLGRDLGSVDASKPDEIQNPKLHLRNLLAQRAYTAFVSEEIARSVNAQVISQRSPSFRSFLDSVRDGDYAPQQQQQP